MSISAPDDHSGKGIAQNHVEQNHRTAKGENLNMKCLVEEKTRRRKGARIDCTSSITESCGPHLPERLVASHPLCSSLIPEHEPCSLLIHTHTSLTQNRTPKSSPCFSPITFFPLTCCAMLNDLYVGHSCKHTSSALSDMTVGISVGD